MLMKKKISETDLKVDLKITRHKYNVEKDFTLNIQMKSAYFLRVEWNVQLEN